MELYDGIKDGLRLNSLTESALPELSAYYTRSRYPNAGLRRPSIEIGGEQARKSISIAREVVDAVDRYFGAKV